MLSSKRDPGETNRVILNLNRLAIFIIFYFIFLYSIVNILAGKFPPVKKNQIKTSQKIPEMGIIFEFVGNTSQGLFTRLIRTLEYT